MGQSDHWHYNPVVPTSIKPDFGGWLLEYRCVDEMGMLPETDTHNDPHRALFSRRLEDHHTIAQYRRPKKLMWEPYVTCVVRNFGERMGEYPEREKVNAVDLLFQPSRHQWANDIKASYRSLFMARRGHKLYRVGWLKEVAKSWGKELV